MSLSIPTARDLLADAACVVVFTGAGVSAESGIPTFRDADGFWTKFPPEQFASWRGITRMIRREPARIAEFLRHVYGPVADAKPNAAHNAVAWWAASGRRVEVVTQNIDGLHQSAGSSVVHEVHGTLMELVDAHGEVRRHLPREELRDISDRLGTATGILSLMRAVWPLVRVEADVKGLRVVRPNVVLFGDAMAEPDWSLAQRAAEECDAMLVVGTSASVYPAALLPEAVLSRDRPVVTVGPEPPESGDWVEGKAGEVLPALLT